MVLTGAGMSTESGIPDYRRYIHDYISESLLEPYQLPYQSCFVAVLMEHTVLVLNHLLIRCVSLYSLAI
jgi:NAD-dependent SIR2 family protein deacetylase